MQIQSESIIQIEREALSRSPENRNILLPPLVNECLLRLASLEVECPSKLGEFNGIWRLECQLKCSDRFHFLNGRLQVAACILLAPSSAIGDVNLISIYGDACNLIEISGELDEEEQMAEYGSTNASMTWNLAAFLILRIGKSHVAEAVDQRRGQKCFFSTINLNKKQSVRTDDVASRATIILSQLWTSKLIIRQPDGTPDPLWLRSRNRLGLSLTYDCFWLWRQEFAGHANPYEGVEGTRPPASVHVELDH